MYYKNELSYFLHAEERKLSKSIYWTKKQIWNDEEDYIHLQGQKPRKLAVIKFRD